MFNIFAPPVYNNEEENNKAFYLFVLMMILLVAVTLSSALLSFLLPGTVNRWIFLLSAGYSEAIITLFLLNKKKLYAASIFCLISFWGITTAMAWTAGGITAPAVMFYFLIVLVAGFLIGLKSGIYVAVICSFTELVMVIAKIDNLLPSNSIKHNDLTLWIAHTFFLVTFVGIHYIFTHKIQKALEKAQNEITERKLMETELSKSEKRFRTLFDNSPVGISIIIKNKIFLVNQAFALMFGFSAPDKLEDTSIKERITDNENEDLSRYIVGEEGEKPYAGSFNLQGVRNNNSMFPIHLEVAHMDISEGDASIAFISDSTETVRREESIKSSLHEKEILLKEVHHRVKNNLQIITSLLRLQADSIDDDHYRSIFNDSVMRIRSMAIIHEKLYQSGNFAKVNCFDYLTELINYLHVSYSINFHKNNLQLEIEQINVSIDTAIPLGLIVNELVTNSLKYAFPAGTSGNLIVKLNSSGPNLCRLLISDDGIGLPQDFDIRKTDSLGLTLVNGLCDQLSATMNFSGRKGTEFTIEFPA